MLGGAPVGVHPPALLVSMECGIERPLPDPEALPRQLLDPAGNSPPMHRRQGKRLENQQVERALHDDGGVGHDLVFSCRSEQEYDVYTPVGATGEAPLAKGRGGPYHRPPRSYSMLRRGKSEEQRVGTVWCRWTAADGKR